MSNLSLFNSFIPCTRGRWNPVHSYNPFDMYTHHHDVSHIQEDDTHYTVEVQVPGISKNDLEIKFKNNVLSICTREKENKEQTNARTYNYSFYIPDHVDTPKIQAELKQGILVIHLPKKEDAKPKAIEITEVV